MDFLLKLDIFEAVEVLKVNNLEKVIFSALYCKISVQILSFEKTLFNYLLTFNTTAASRMSGFTKKSNFEDEFEFLVGGNGSGSDDWKTGNANNNNRIDKGRKISKTFFPVFNSSKKQKKNA